MISVLAGLARWRWLLPLNLALAIWWALVVDPNTIQGRFLNAAVQGVQVIMFLAPATAVAGVLAGASLRRNAQRVRTGSRGSAALAAGVCAIHVVIALVALSLSSLMVRLSSNASGFDGWQLLALAGLTAGGASAVGQALGRGLPEVVAAPTALLGSYVVLAFPRTFAEPLWLRHLVFVDSCCNSTDRVSPRVLTAILLMAVSTIVAGLLATLRAGRALPGLIGAAAVLAVAWTVSTGLVRDLDWSPATARTGDVECTQAADGEVCVWPENAAALPRLADVWTGLRETARAHGLELPTTVTERTGGPVTYGDGLMSITPQTSAEAFPEVLATAALPSVEPCIVNGTMDSRIDNAWLTLARWWISTSGFTYSANLIDPPYDYLDVPSAELDQRLGVLVDSIRACDPGSLP